MKNIKRHELKIKDSTEDLNEVDFEIQLFIDSHLRTIKYKMITRMVK